MSGWLLWVVAGCAFAVAEMLTMGFFLAPFALGAGFAAIAAAAGGGAVVAWPVFIVASLLSLGVIRPLALSHARTPPQIRTGTAALVGRPAVVVQRISNAAGEGSVRIDGDVWTARAFDEDHVIEPGARVEVVQIKGATALVTE